MSFKMPSTDQVRKLGDSLGMEVTEDYANSFIDFIRPAYAGRFLDRVGRTGRRRRSRYGDGR